MMNSCFCIRGVRRSIAWVGKQYRGLEIFGIDSMSMLILANGVYSAIV